MIDDEATDFKVKGCKTLRVLLSKVDDGMLQRTGLGEVFEQAVLPILSHLPTLTPMDESRRLLNQAYPTLIALARTRFPSERNTDKRLKCLDKMVREGVERGCVFAGEYPDIIADLMEQLALLFDEMGIYAVKHLKVRESKSMGILLQHANAIESIIPLLVDNLCNPFITAHDRLLVTSAKALQTVILNCWPRIPVYGGDILKGATICWFRLTEDIIEKPSFVEARDILQDAVGLLRAALADEAGALAAMDETLESDPRLRGLKVAEATRNPGH